MLGRLGHQLTVALVELLTLRGHDLRVLGVVPEVQGMGRCGDGVGAVPDPQHDGLQQQQVPEDLVGVLAEALVQRLERLAQLRVQRLICRDVRQEHRASFRVCRHGQRLHRQ